MCQNCPSSRSIDPNAVQIGDTLKIEESKHALAFAVTDVDHTNARAKVYNPIPDDIIHRWMELTAFGVHISNDDLQTDDDRTEWLNDVLLQPFKITDDDNEIPLEYVITDIGVEREPVEE